MKKGNHHSKSLYIPIIKEGTTLIRELLEQVSIIGVIDPEKKKIYAKTNEINSIKKLFKYTETKDDMWMMEETKLKGEYVITSLENIDNNQSITEGLWFIIRDAECTPTHKDECINMYDRNTRKFIGSWKLPWDADMCELVERKICRGQIHFFTVDLYPDEDCVGTPTSKQVSWVFCHIS